MLFSTYSYNMHTFIRLIRNSIITITCIVIISFYWLAATQNGLNFIVSTINHYFSENIVIHGVHGIISKQITINKIVYKQNGYSIKLENTSIKPNLLKLIKRNSIRPEAHTAIASVSKDNNILTSLKDLKVNFLYRHSNIFTNIIFSNESIKNNIQISGKPNNYHVKVISKFAQQTLILKGDGNQDHLNLSSQDNMNINIAAAWDKKFTWNISLDNNNTPVIISEYKIDKLKFNAHGNLTNYNLKLQQLDATLNGILINATAAINKNESITKAYLDINSNHNNINIDAIVNEDINLAVKLKLEKMSELYDFTQGSLNGYINFSGSLDSPKIVGQLDLDKFSYKNMKITKLISTVNYDGSENSIWNLALKSLSYKNNEINEINSKAKGNLALSKIIISLLSKESKMNSNLLLKNYNGKHIIEILNFDSTYKNYLTYLDKPTTMSIQDRKITLETTHIKQDSKGIGSLSFNYDLAKNNWQINATAANVALGKIGGINIDNNINIKNGIVAANLELAGNNILLSKHQGYFSITDADLYLPQQNIYPILKVAKVNFNDKSIDSNITLKSFSGFIDASVRTKYNNLYSKIIVTGDNFLLYNTNEIAATIKPQIDVTISDKIYPSGTIDILKAKINIANDESVITLPYDVVISDKENYKNYVYDPASAISLNLGKNTNIAVIGINSNLQGTVELKVAQDYNVKVSGVINMTEGSYDGFGQELKINPSSNLIYKDDYFYSPKLDITLEKKIENIDSNNPTDLDGSMAGLHITGNVENPKTTFFSSPTQLSETEIIAMLITGKANSFNGEENNMSSLSIGTSILASTEMFKKIQKKLFLDEISIESHEAPIDNSESNIQNDFRVTLGKKITNNFFLRGRFALFSDDFILSAQYNILDNLLLRVYTNEFSQGLNVLYKFTTK